MEGREEAERITDEGLRGLRVAAKAISYMPIVVGLYLAGAAAARAAALAHREPRDAAGDRPSLVMNQMS